MSRSRDALPGGVPTPSGVLSLAAATAGVVVVAVSPYTLAAGVLGLALVAVGLGRRSGRAFSAGAACLFAAVVVTGALGMAPSFVLLAASLVAVSWSVGRNGLTIAAEVGADTPTLRVEAVHAVGTVALLAVGASVGFGVFLVATGGHSALALVALLVGVVALLVGL